jgi:hypothetical protein
MTENEKKANFARLFPPAVEKLLDRLRVVKQKSAKGNYAWDEALVHDTWVQIARIFAQTAESFGVKFEVLVNGTEVDYTEPKSTKRKPK